MVLIEKIQKLGMQQKIIDEKNKLLEYFNQKNLLKNTKKHSFPSIKQTIQAFLVRANEITALDVNNPALKKKGKNEKSEKTLLFEKMDFLKKKLENETFFIVVIGFFGVKYEENRDLYRGNRLAVF